MGSHHDARDSHDEMAENRMLWYELGRLTPAQLERLAGLRGKRRLYEAKGRRRRDGSRLLYEFSLSSRSGVDVRIPRVVKVGLPFVEYTDERFPVPVARVPRSLVWKVLDSPADGFHWSAAIAQVRGQS